MMQEDKFTSMARQMSKWVDHVLGPSYHQYYRAKAWTPAINFYEGQTHYCLIVELAGVAPDEIDLRVEKGTLILTGNRAAPGLPDSSDCVRLLMMEIDHGQFRRTLELPDDIDADGISATYRNGYLRVRLPKIS